MYLLCAFKNLQNHINQPIQIAKQNYVNKIAQKLGDPNTSSKCYQSLLKTLLNGKKIPSFLLYFMMINIFFKKVVFSILFPMNNVSRFQTEASYHLNYHCGQIAHYLLVILQKMTSFEKSITQTQIKLIAAMKLVFAI